MRTRSRIAAILCAAAFAVAAVAATYTWTGEVDYDWDDSGNWDAGGLEGYPDDPGDDAILPLDADRYTIYLVTEQIDDLTIKNSYNFSAAGGSPVLTVESLNINAGSSQTAFQITITGAQINTH